MDQLVELPKIYLENSLKLHSVYEMLVQKILEEIKKIPNLQIQKLNPELTKLICTLVESCVEKGGKIDKKKLVIEILAKLFTLTEVEKIFIASQIEFILDNKLVKKLKRKLTSKIYDKFNKTFTTEKK